LSLFFLACTKRLASRTVWRPSAQSVDGLLRLGMEDYVPLNLGSTISCYARKEKEEYVVSVGAAGPHFRFRALQSHYPKGPPTMGKRLKWF